MAMVQTVYSFMAGAILVSGTVHTYVPWSKVAILGMVIPPLIGILIMGI